MNMKTKAEADYSPGKPHAHCGLCQHFTPPHDCSIVKGPVDPDMWCKYFKRKTIAGGK